MCLRAPSAACTATAAACVLALALVPVSVAGAASEEQESEAAFQQQLAARQIRAAIVNRHLRRMRLTLRDGRHVVAVYPKRHFPALRAQLEAKHVKVTVLTPSQAKQETKKLRHPHHKLRYIVGGVLVVVIVLVAALVLMWRRRRLD
jgi:hypothetical protein